MRRFVAGAAVALLVLGTCVLRWQKTAAAISCRDTPVLEVPSPDGRFSAIVLERNCGATAGYVTFVRLADRGWPSSGRTVVEYSGSAVNAVGPVVTVRWHPHPGGLLTSPEGTVGNELVIEYPCEPTRIDARRWNDWFVRAQHRPSLTQTTCERWRRSGPNTETRTPTLTG